MCKKMPMIEEALCEEQICAYTRKDWRPLIELIPQIESISTFGEWSGGERNDNGVFSMPYCMAAPIVVQFLEIVYAVPIMISFKWSKWDEGRKIAHTDFDFDTVNLVTKCKLITAIVRNDRFCEGALVSAFDSGLILRILKSIEKQVVEIENKSTSISS